MSADNDLHRALGRVESKVDIILQRTDGFDTRLTKVERKTWFATGAAAVVAFLTTHVVGFLRS